MNNVTCYIWLRDFLLPWGLVLPCSVIIVDDDDTCCYCAIVIIGIHCSVGDEVMSWYIVVTCYLCWLLWYCDGIVVIPCNVTVIVEYYCYVLLLLIVDVVVIVVMLILLLFVVVVVLLLLIMLFYVTWCWLFVDMKCYSIVGVLWYIMLVVSVVIVVVMYITLLFHYVFIVYYLLTVDGIVLLLLHCLFCSIHPVMMMRR